MDSINYLTKKHTFAFSIFDNRLPSETQMYLNVTELYCEHKFLYKTFI